MSVISIAASGLAAATAQLNVSAQNVVSSPEDGATGSAPGGAPVGNAAPSHAYAPLQLVQFSVPLDQGGGVQTATRPAQAADDPVTEAVSQIEALNQFKASADLFKAGEEMMAVALKLTV